MGLSSMVTKREHAFSIELKSKELLRNVTIRNDIGENVLIEGYLGELKQVSLEEALLEVRGSNGVIRLDLSTKTSLYQLKKIRKLQHGSEIKMKRMKKVSEARV